MFWTISAVTGSARISRVSARIGSYARMFPDRPGAVELLARSEREPGQDGMEDPGSRRPWGAGHLPAGAVPFPVFLPRGERRAVRVGRIHSRTFDGGPGETRARAESGDRGLLIRTARRGSVSQHRCGAFGRWR